VIKAGVYIIPDVLFFTTMSNFDSALINGALQQGGPRPLQKRYIVKNPNPLPKGRFSIRIIEREHDIGAAVDLLDVRCFQACFGKH